jgi:hypothetical protein
VMKEFVLSYKMKHISPSRLYPWKRTKFLKCLTPLESSFSSSDVGNKETHKEEDSKRKVGEIISLNIGTLDSPKNVNIGTQCAYEEKLKLTKLLREFQDVFAWSYEDLRGFDLSLIQHAIPIKEGIKLVRKKKDPLTPHLKLLLGRSWKNFLKLG